MSSFYLCTTPITLSF